MSSIKKVTFLKLTKKLTKPLLVGSFLSVLLFVGGCVNREKMTHSVSSDHPLLQDSQDIISTRPQNSSQVILILKLKNAALMQNSEIKDGKAVIDEKLLLKINGEQAETIAAAQKLSTEVQVLYKYKMVLNGLAILAPIELVEKLGSLGQVAYSERAGNFSLPSVMELSNSENQPAFNLRNSAKFIGAEKVNQQGITGKGISVGIIDTGIDFTHSMFRGAGSADAYKAIDPSKAAKGFPNERVVGGLDLVGTEFDSASPDFLKRIPKPDANPLDEGGHGTHVAGTVAGLGDGVNTYNGMASEALLYAIKVFGAEGSTSDSVVIAALEYSADPNGDGSNADQLDVVNMSLGSGYGNPHILYSEAIKNLVSGGTVVVASAGNSGHKNYIVGAPGSTTEALSVAASVDDGDQNWKFNLSKIHIGSAAAKESIIVDAIEAVSAQKISEVGNVTGRLVYAGAALQDFNSEQKAALKGNVALIDRGGVTFNEKLVRAASAEVRGVVVVNNSAGAPIAMGTKDPFPFPAIMIGQAEGKKIKDALKNADPAQAVAEIEFLIAEKREKPFLIDTLTDFTSKGPRSLDGYLKPEISAPGNNVISAKMGAGASAVQMSGTSMAAPHMAGVMALIKQAHPGLSALELKSIAMGTSTTIFDRTATSEKIYPITLQGAGRVQAEKAVAAKMVVLQSSISLGEISVIGKKTLRQNLTLKNLSADEQILNVYFEGSPTISMTAPTRILLKGNASLEVPLTLTLDTTKIATELKENHVVEMDGWVKFANTAEVYRVPVLAVAHRLSDIKAKKLTVMSSSELDAEGASVSVSLANKSQNAGEVLLFNWLAADERKPAGETFMTNACDLQAAGYRLVKKKLGDTASSSELVLQVAIKTYKPMTTWNSCDVSVLIDTDRDGIPEQELIGSALKSIPGETSEEFASTLLDSQMARQLRKEFEIKVKEAKGDSKKLAELKTKESYAKAYLDRSAMGFYNNSTVAIVEAPVAALAKTKEGNLVFSILTTLNEQSNVQIDDFLAVRKGKQLQIPLQYLDQPFVDLPSSIALKGGENREVEFTAGSRSGKLLVLLPQNKTSNSDLDLDQQAQVLKPAFISLPSVKAVSADDKP